MNNTKQISLYKKLVSATQYSVQGFYSAIKHEQAFRLELIFYSLALPISLYFSQSSIEQALLVLATMLVFITELLNSGIEAVVDRISFKHHELSGRAKDFGSAAVFLCQINAFVIWAIFFIPRIIQ